MEQDTGERGKNTMKNQTIDPMMPVGELKQIKDFLPPPDQLVMPETTIKVTLSLTKSSLEFFKREAKKHHTKYQKMIRALVDRYAHQY